MPPAKPESDSAYPWASLRGRAVRGSAWWVGTYPISKGVQIVGSVILASLLSPAAFGIVAIGSIAVKAVQMFSEIGINAALIQNPRDDIRFVNTGWTMQIGRGFVVFAASVALATPMSYWYGEPQLRAIIPAIGLGAVIAGLQSTKYVMLNRQLHERPRALLNLANGVVTRVAMIAMAWFVPTAWCLVVGSLVGTLFFTVATHALPGHGNRLCWDGAAARTLMRFGGWIFVGTLIAFFAGQIDTLVLGQIATKAAGSLGIVGIYEIAQRMAKLPLEATSLIGGQLAFPVLSEVARRDPDRFRERLLQIRGALLPAGMAMCLGVIVLAPYFFEVLYDARYADAQWMAPLITIAVWFGMLNSFINPALLSLGRTASLAVSSGVGAAAALGGGVLGYGIAGVPGFLLGVAAGRLVEHLSDSFFLARAGAGIHWHDLRMSAVFALLASACAGCRAWTVDSPSALVRWGVGAGVPMLILAIVTTVTARAALRVARRP